MLSLLIAAAVTAFVAACILKGFKAQAILMAGGILMMAASILMNGHPPLSAEVSTGSVWLDIFQFIRNTFQAQGSGLGLKIMAIAGFACYLSAIGASGALVRILTKPLKYVHNYPYLFLAGCFFIGEFLSIFITSASGLGILLMVTIYPLLLSVGLSKASAAAPIATAVALEIGPGQGNVNFAADLLNIDVVDYVVDYQITVAIVGLLSVALLHIICQKWFDKMAGYVPSEHVSVSVNTAEMDSRADNKEEEAPAIYALLPVIPLILIFTFSKLVISSISMDVTTAMFISLAIALGFEFVRRGNAMAVANSIQEFFDGMGRQFANVVTFIIAGQTFAHGLKTTGAIEAIITGAQAVGFGGSLMTLVMVAIIMATAILMGSGNAAFFSFASLVPNIAARMGVSPVSMLLPMQFVAGMSRNISPIAPNVVAIAGLAGISPFELAKRNLIPMAGGIVAVVCTSLLLFS